MKSQLLFKLIKQANVKPYDFGSSQYKSNGEQLGLDVIRIIRLLNNFAKHSPKMNPQQLEEREAYIKNNIFDVGKKLNVKMDVKQDLQKMVDSLKGVVKSNYLSSLSPFSSIPGTYRKFISSAEPVLTKYINTNEGQTLKNNVTSGFNLNKTQKYIKSILEPLVNF